MNKEVADKWVAELRNGKHEQCKETMFDGKAMCCLGVLAIHVLDRDEETLIGEDWLIATDVIKAGMASDRGLLPNEDIVSLSYLNDSGKDFLQIADVIEKHWEEL